MLNSIPYANRTEPLVQLHLTQMDLIVSVLVQMHVDVLTLEDLRVSGPTFRFMSAELKLLVCL